MPFLNPYHFVPVKTGARGHDIDKEALGTTGAIHVTHDRYVGGGYSGRILCRLEAETPFFVGGEITRTATAPRAGAVAPFLREGRAAIPATSLRGMLSSLAESASNSALRVFHDRFLTFRTPVNQALGAIGMVLKKTGGSDGYMLRPLALLPLRRNMQVPAEYRAVFPEPVLKIFIEGYRRRPRTNPPEREPDPGSFLDTVRPASFSPDSSVLWYMRLPIAPSYDPANPSVVRVSNPRWNSRNSEYLLGQQSAGGAPITAAQWGALSPADQGYYTPGILRVLGVAGRSSQMPQTKKHEIFIPLPGGYGHWQATFPLLEASDAVATFHEMAHDRTEDDSSLPYEVQGSTRGGTPIATGGRHLRLRSGDLVFFRLSPGGGRVVQEVAVSAIWRKHAGRCSEYFDSEHLPFHPGRTKISIGEQLFGFVEKTAKVLERQMMALAGRVRFSDGRLEGLRSESEQVSETPPGGEFLASVTRKILDQPKPPSPSLYFNRANGTGAYIPKTALHPGQHRPKGRKVYLHHPRAADEPVYETSNSNFRCAQKYEITPVRKGSVFYFHVDFDNLSEGELNLLAFSLRPFGAFRHKLGMGKSIGLGTVRIDPVGLFLVNRSERYNASGMFGPRYDKTWVAENEGPSAWPERYAAEGTATVKPLGGAAPSLVTRADDWAKQMDCDIKQALNLLGNPGMVHCEVKTPVVPGQNGEDETYRWFVQNDRAMHQHLKPLGEHSLRIDPLSETREWRTK